MCRYMWDYLRVAHHAEVKITSHKPTSLRFGPARTTQNYGSFDTFLGALLIEGK